MASTAHGAFDLSGTYVHLRDTLEATAVPVGPDFWRRRAVVAGTRYRPAHGAGDGGVGPGSC